ncbi:MAG: hypothetical protein JWL59_4647 [Chthoniobacteraceae bacterium]|nr:hypothetical protein [Chthoniobacteraceae bacterium]
MRFARTLRDIFVDTIVPVNLTIPFIRIASLLVNHHLMHTERRPRTISERFKKLLPTPASKRQGRSFVEVLEQRIAPATGLIVTTTADSGPGSLRQVLLDAASNGTTLLDTITFAIPGAGLVKTIQPTTPLPDVSANVFIDGYSQSGSSANTLGFGNNARLNIVLDGSLAGPANGLHLLGNDTLKGLVIQGFQGTSGIVGNGILMDGGLGNNTISGNWIGVDQTGLIDKGNAQAGIALKDAGNGNVIGTSAPADRNLLSGNAVGLELTGTATSNTSIVNNFIGTDKTGTADLGNDTEGVRIALSQNSTSGSLIRENVISGNNGNGIVLSNTVPGNVDAHQLLKNAIGTDQAGTAVLGNTLSGVVIQNSSGNVIGTVSGDGNTIAFNGGTGISVIGTQARANTIRANSIYGNAGIGIDLGNNGVTLNDSGDGDAGANNLQNFPVINSALRTSSSNIAGTLNGQPGATYTIDLFSSPAGDASGYGEGKSYVGSQTVTADTSGNLNFNYSTTNPLTQGAVVSATATDSAGNSSEFSKFAQLVTDFTWQGSTSSDWFDPSNWFPFGVPGASDSATLNNSTTLSLGSSATVGVFYQLNGTLTGAGGLTITSNFHWSGGTETGPGSTTVLSSATLSIDTTATHTLSGRTLSNAGSATWSGGRITLGSGAVFQNDGSFLDTVDEHIGWTGTASATFNNAGSFIKNSTGTGTFIDSSLVRFNNTGSLAVQSGLLSITSPESVATSGTFNVQAGTKLVFDSNRTFTGSIFGAGDVSFTSGVQSVGGTYNITGTSAFGPAQSVTFLAGATVTSLIGPGKTLSHTGGTTDFKASLPSLASNPLVISGGSMNFENNAVSVPSFTFTAGAFISNATLDINSAFTWVDNTTMSGAGTTNANAGTTLAATSGTEFLTNGRVFRNPAGQTVAWTGSNSISIDSGALFKNEGTFLAQKDGSILTSAGGAFSNDGTFIKSGGSFITAAGVFNNSGTVSLQTGTLIGQQFTQTAGTTQLRGGVLASGSSSLTFQGGTLTGAGTVTGNLSNTGGTIQPNGPAAAIPSLLGIAPGNPGTINISGNYIQTAGGKLAVDLGGTTQYDRLNVGGNATLDGTLDIAFINGFVPAIGNSFDVITYTGHTGSFSSLTGASAGFSQNVQATKLSIVRGVGSYVWDAGGGTDTSWFTAANWNPDGVPGATDSASLNSALTITLPSNTSVASFLQSAGTFTGAGTLSITGGFTWSGGNQTGSGITSVAAGAGLSITGGNKHLERRLDNSGNATWNSITPIDSGNGGIFNNFGTLDFQSDGGLTYDLGGTQTIFNNAGTFTKSNGSGTTAFFNVEFNNGGIVNANAGTLSFPGTGLSTGTFNVANTGTLSFGGSGLSQSLGAASQINSAGAVTFRFGTINLAGGFNSASTTIFANSIVNFDSAAATTETLTQSAGTLGGSGKLTITGNFDWSGGIQNGSGITAVDAGATFAITGANKQLERRIDNAGTATWNTTTVTDSGNGGIFNNIGTLNLLSDGGLTYDLGGTQTVFNNSGILTRSAGSGIFAFTAAAFNNSGTVNANTGTLSLGGGGLGTSLFNIAGILNFGGDGRTHNLSATSQISGSGTVNFDLGTASIAGAYNVGTTNILANSTVNFDGSDAGTGVLNQSTGTLGGTGMLTVTSSFAWTGGAQKGSGITKVAAGGTMTISGGSKTLERRIDNSGSVIWNSPSDISSGNGAIFNNFGSINLQGDGGIAYDRGGTVTTFNNSGTLSKSGGSGTTVFGGSFNNSGSINAKTGVLAMNGVFTQTAGATALTGGGISAVSPLLFTGGELIGSGTITGSVSNSAATVKPGGNAAAGLLTITGNYTQGSAGTLAVELGGGGALSDQLNVAGTATLDGTLNVALINGFLPLTGSAYNVLSYGSHSGTFPTLSGDTGFAQNYQASALSIVRSSLDYVWNGSISTDWFNASNWTPNGVPGAADNATISTASNAVNVSGQNAAIHDLNFSGNTLFGNARLDVGGTMTWTSGIIELNTSINSGALLNISGGANKLLRGNNAATSGILTIASGASAVWSGTGDLQFQNLATINNAGTFEARNNQSFSYISGGTPVFTNLGTFTKTNSGTTSIPAAVSFVNNGTLNTAAGAVVELGNFAITNDAKFTGPGITRAIGNVSIAGNIHLGANATLELQTGQLIGSGTFDGAGVFNWTGGEIRGQVSIAGGSMMLISGTADKRLNGNNAGTAGILTINSGASVLWKDSGDFQFQNLGIVNNSGTFNVANNEPLAFISGSTPLFNNLSGGLFIKTVAGTTTVDGSISFTNAGTVSTVSSATVDFANLTLTDGALFAGSGLSRVSTGTVKFGAGANVSIGAGSVFELTGGGTLSGTGKIGGAGNFNWSGGTIAAQLDIAAGSTMLITGAADKLLRGDNAGTSGNLNILPTAAVQWNGTGNVQLQNLAAINNSGHFSVQNSQSLAYVSGGEGRFNNAGVFVKSGSGTTIIGSSVRFVNSGMVAVSTAGALVNFALLDANAGGAFNGPGISRAIGTLNLSGTNTLTGGPVLELAGGTLNGTGTFAGSGQFNWSSGTILGNVAVATGSTLFLTSSGGKLLGGNNAGTSGILTISVGATVHWQDASDLQLQNLAMIDNRGTFEVANNQSILSISGSTPLFENHATGVFTKTTPGLTTVESSVTFHNEGTINAAAGATIDFQTLRLADGNKLTGPGLSRVASGSLVLEPGATTLGTNATLELTGSATLSGGGSVGGDGHLNWSGGTITGTLIVGAGSTLFITGSAPKLLNGNNAGTSGLIGIPSSSTVLWSGTGDIQLQNRAAIDNNGRFIAQNSQNVTYISGGEGHFNNHAGGTFIKAGAGTTTFGNTVRFVNEGEVNIATAGATIDFQLLDAADAGTFTGLGISRAIGTLALAGNTPLGAGATLELAGGTLTGSGTFAGQGNFNWSSGTVAGNVNVAAGSMMLITGAADKLLRGNNAGTSGILAVSPGGAIVWNGTGNLLTQNQAIINNAGLFNAQNSQSFSYLSGSEPLFNNLSGGTFTKSGIGTTSFGSNIRFINSGSVNVAIGGAAIDFQLLDTANGSAFTGPGLSRVLGTLAIAGTTTIGAGSMLELAGGTLTGTGTFAGTGNFNWSSGTITGVPTIGSGSSMLISGNGTKLLRGNNAGTSGILNISNGAGVVWATPGSITLQNLAIINNAGTFDSQNDHTFLYGGGSAPLFHNLATGTLLKSAGSGGTVFEGATKVDNAGTIEVRTGTLVFNSSLTQTAGITRLNGGNIATAGTILLQGGILGGTGTVVGNISNAATVAPGNNGAGILTVTGNYAQTSAGTLAVELGGTAAGTEHDQLNVAGTTTLAGALSVAYTGGFIPGTGDQFRVIASTSNPGIFPTAPANVAQTPSATGLTISIITPSQPDLSLTQDDGVTVTMPGSILSYTLGYKNDGPLPASGVQLTEILPDGTTFNAAASTAGWTETTPGIYKLFIGTLASGATGTAIFATAVNSPAASGLTQITATASIAGAGGADLTPANNSATDSDTLNATPDLVLSKSDGATETTPGSLLSYTLNYHNDGTRDATGVTLTETLPAGTTFNATASSQGWVETAPGIFKLNVGALAAGGTGGTATFAVNVVSTAPAGLDTISGTALIADDNSNGTDLNPANNTGTDSDLLNAAPDLVLTHADGVTATTPGSLLTYNLAYHNDGHQDATGVVLTETLPAGTSFNANASDSGWIEATPGVFTFAIGNLAAGTIGGTVKFAVNVKSPAAAGLDQIEATVAIADDASNGADLTPGNNTAADSNTLDAAPDLQVSIADDPAVAKRGGITHYTLTYGNRGNQDAAGVFLLEQLPANSTFVPLESSSGWTETTPGSGLYQLAIGNLSAGATAGSATFSVRLASNLPVGYLGLTPSVSVDDDHANGADLNSLNNSAVKTTPIYQGVYIVAPGVGTPRGATPIVRVFDISTGAQTLAFSAYEESYRGGVRIAAGDINGDGFDDIITSTRLGSGRIRVFDGVTGVQFSEVFGEINAFVGRAAHGAFVSSGDVTGDGRDDIIVGSGRGGGIVQIYDGQTGSLVNSYTPFGKGFKGGVRVAIGDVDGNGIDDVVVSQGDSGSRVQVYSGATTTILQDFKAAPKSYRSGIFVAAADIDGDGKADIIAGRDIHSAAIVESFSGIDHHSISRIVAFGNSYRNGVRVAATDVNFDGIADIIATSGTKGGSQVKIFDGKTSNELPGFSAFPNFPDVSLFAAATTRAPSVS